MAELLVHREQDEGMSFGGRVVSALQQWIPLLQRTVPTTNIEQQQQQQRRQVQQRESEK
jgi:hypothetical protein